MTRNLGLKEGDVLLESNQECFEDLEKNKIIPIKTLKKVESTEGNRNIFKNEICKNLEKTSEL